MALLPIDHDLTTHGIQLGELATNLLLQGEHDGASSIDELDVALASELIDGWCFSVGTEEHALSLELLEGLVVDRLHTLGLQAVYLLVVVYDVAEAVELFVIFLQLFFGVLDCIDDAEAEARLLVYFDLGIHAWG